MTYTVRHTTAAYDVIGSSGERIDRYAYNPADFDSRREAWRLALEDAEVRNVAELAATHAAIDAAWASRYAVRQAVEAQALAAQERDAVVEALLLANANTAADYVAAGAAWHYEAGALIVQRHGGERHQVRGHTCTCSAGQRGRKCWAVAVSEALAPAEVIARRAA